MSPWQPAEPHVSPAPSFDWPEIRIHERVSETKSDRQLSHLRSRDSSSPDVALQLDTLSPQPSQSLQNEAQELVEREASSSSKVSHEYRCRSSQPDALVGLALPRCLCFTVQPCARTRDHRSEA